MVAITKDQATVNCPRCGGTHLNRIPRRIWMRMFKYSRRYQCNDCGKQFFVLNGLNM